MTSISKGLAFLSMAMAACVSSFAEDVSVRIDFDTPTGAVKPVHGIGQGPLLGWIGTKLFTFLGEAGIPYARLHDVGGAFGGGRFVDIHNVFPNFDADEDDPANYDFRFTDLYLQALIDNGVEPFYRLGESIENCAASVGPKYVHPPRDFAKWARICEHIVRHYTRGWANGYNWKIAYWEIWNEPENNNGNRPVLWQGTFRQYCELYDVTSKLLKSKYPEIKVGGYGACGFYSLYGDMGTPALHERYAFFTKCFDDFLAYVKEHGCPLDFFSYHIYDKVENVRHYINYPREKLDAAGFKDTEISINEWMIVGGGPCGGVRCASKLAEYLMLFQNGPVDTAMVYDGRCQASPYAPLFRRIDREEPGAPTPGIGVPRPGYYALLYFNELKKLGKVVSCSVDGQAVQALAATDGQDAGAVLLVNTTDALIWPKVEAGDWRRGVSRLTAEGSMDALSADLVLPPRAIALVKFRRGAKRKATRSTNGVIGQ